MRPGPAPTAVITHPLGRAGPAPDTISRPTLRPGPALAAITVEGRPAHPAAAVSRLINGGGGYGARTPGSESTQAGRGGIRGSKRDSDSWPPSSSSARVRRDSNPPPPPGERRGRGDAAPDSRDAGTLPKFL